VELPVPRPDHTRDHPLQVQQLLQSSCLGAWMINSADDPPGVLEQGFYQNVVGKVGSRLWTDGEVQGSIPKTSQHVRIGAFLNGHFRGTEMPSKTGKRRSQEHQCRHTRGRNCNLAPGAALQMQDLVTSTLQLLHGGFRSDEERRSEAVQCQA